jgi:hypothetical protein
MPVDILHCVLLPRSEGEASVPSPPEGFVIIGYDFGYINSDSDHYSVLFHEILYGLYEDLRQYNNSVNDVLLFPSLKGVRQASATRARLVEEGADLETIDHSDLLAVQVSIPVQK